MISKKSENQIKKIQYHKLMSKKHRGKARFHYTNLIKIVRNDKNAKEILKRVGRKNEIFNDPKTCDKKMKHISHRKMLRDDLILETCGQSSHIHGCYIRFSSNKTHHSKSRGDDADVIVDYDTNGAIVGIEFYEGLKNENKRYSKRT